MALIELETAEHNTRELEIILRLWELNRDSNRVDFQRIRSREIGMARRMIKNLVEDVKPEHRLELTTGSEPIPAVHFLKDAYDFVRAVHHDLEPNISVPLTRLREMTDWQDPEHLGLYVGRTVFVGLGSMAKTIIEGGGLSLVEARTDEPASSGR